MSELTDLINRIQRGIDKKSDFIKTIKHPRLLVASLKELSEVIGNESLKDSVATQISHMIVMKRRAKENSEISEDKVMLNTLINSSAGTGKTLCGTIIAKIYYALGYIKGTQNATGDKKGLGDRLKDAIGSNTGSSSTTNDDALAFYVIVIFIIILVTFISLTWSFYEKFGGSWTIAALIFIVLLIIIFGIIVVASLNSDNSTSSTADNNIVGSNEVPALKQDNSQDSKIIKIVSRDDFIGQYVGWTAKKTLTLLNESLGKVLFVDEAYSLINGPHDQFGMEALTTLNLFMSQHPNEIIVIFAGYKDLIETNLFSIQPGLKSRFMWQFECTPYNANELFQIFKLQLKKKGWGLTDEKQTLRLFEKHYAIFIGYGRDTERAAFFSELEHSRDFIADEQGMSLNLLTPSQVERGINKLRENNFSTTSSESSNPLANMMKMMGNNPMNYAMR